MAIKEVFLNNIGWKIGGIVLALMLWTHLATEKTYESTFKAKIEFSGLSENLYVERMAPEIVEIAVVGTGKQLAYLALFQKPMIRIDLSTIDGPGIFDYAFTPFEIYTIDPLDYAGITFPSGDDCSISIKRKI